MENISHYIVERAFQKRQILAIYAFFGYFMAYSMRTILSVAIIDMDGSKSHNHSINKQSEKFSANETDVQVFQTIFLN